MNKLDYGKKIMCSGRNWFSWSDFEAGDFSIHVILDSLKPQKGKNNLLPEQYF